MQKPIIKVNDKEYEIQKIKPKQWREFFEFDEKRSQLPFSEFMDDHCQAIAGFFDESVTVDFLLENAEIADILKVYHEIKAYLMELVVSKLGAPPKNVNEGDNPK